jgi:hypothetical protein
MLAQARVMDFQKVLVLDVLQKAHHVRVRADCICDVEQRESHLRRDVVGRGLRERVGRACRR